MQINQSRYQYMAAGCENGELLLFDSRMDQACIHKIVHSKDLYAISWNKSNPNILATGSLDTEILVWKFKDWSELSLIS